MYILTLSGFIPQMIGLDLAAALMEKHLPVVLKELAVKKISCAKTALLVAVQMSAPLLKVRLSKAVLNALKR